MDNDLLHYMQQYSDTRWNNFVSHLLSNELSPNYYDYNRIKRSASEMIEAQKKPINHRASVDKIMLDRLEKDTSIKNVLSKNSDEVIENEVDDKRFMRFCREYAIENKNTPKLMPTFLSNADLEQFYKKSINNQSTQTKRFLRFGKRNKNNLIDKTTDPASIKRFLMFVKGFLKPRNFEHAPIDKSAEMFGNGLKKSNRNPIELTGKKSMRFGRDHPKSANISKKIASRKLVPIISLKSNSDDAAYNDKRFMRFGKRFMRFGREQNK